MSTIVTREYKQKQKSKTKENIWTDIQVDGAGFKVMCVTHPKNIQPLSSWGEEGQGGSQPSTFRTTFTRRPVHLCLLASRLPLIYQRCIFLGKGGSVFQDEHYYRSVQFITLTSHCWEDSLISLCNLIAIAVSNVYLHLEIPNMLGIIPFWNETDVTPRVRYS